MEERNKPEFIHFYEMFKELKCAGYLDINDFKSGRDYVAELKKKRFDFKEFIQIVIKWLPKIEYKVGGLALLKETGKKYDGRVIIPIFEDSNSFDRWRICDIIVHNPPMNVNDWIRDTYLDRGYDYSDTGLLPLAIVKIFPPDEARKILRKGFDHHYRVTPEAFGKVGKAEDIPFLEKKLKLRYDASHVTRDIEKAIKKIVKREKL